MELSHHYSRRSVLKTGLATAAAATIAIPKANAQYSPPDPKKPGEIRKPWREIFPEKDE